MHTDGSRYRCIHSKLSCSSQGERPGSQVKRARSYTVHADATCTG